MTATSTLSVIGLTTLGNASTTVLSVSGNTYITGILSVTGNSIFLTASSTGIVKFSEINSDTGSISFGDENLSTSGNISSPHTAQEAYYTVYKNGSTYYARNGVTGYLDYSNANADTVVNWALANLPDTLVTETVIVNENPDSSMATFEFIIPAVDPGTLTLTFTSANDSIAYTILDTGNTVASTNCNQGGTGTALITSCTINYVTGVVTLVTVAPNVPKTGTNITAGYTHGRTWMERVVVKSNVSIDESILMPSYSWLDLQGEMRITALGATIKNSDTTNGNSYIKITGGIIDAGNIANNIFDMTKVINFYIQNSTFGNSLAGCLETQGVTSFEISNNTIYGCGDDGLSILEYSKDGKITNNDISRNNGGATVGSTHIEIEDGSSDIVISHNTLHDQMNGFAVNGGNRGISVVIDPSATFDAPKNVIIDSNVLRDIQYPIVVHTNKDNVSIKNVTISNNVITHSTLQSNDNAHGIYVLGGSSIRKNKQINITNNTIKNYYVGVNLDWTDNSVISGNVIGTTYSAGIFILSSTGIRVSGNQIDDVGGGVNWKTSIWNGCASTLSTYNVFDNNSITNSDGAGYFYSFGLDADCNYTYFTNNQISGFGAQGLTNSSIVNGTTVDNQFFQGNTGSNFLTVTAGDYGAESTVFNNNNDASGDILQTIYNGIKVGQTRTFYMSVGDATADGAVLTFTDNCDPAVDTDVDGDCSCTFDAAKKYLSVIWDGYYWRFNGAAGVGYTCTAADI